MQQTPPNQPPPKQTNKQTNKTETKKLLPFRAKAAQVLGGVSEKGTFCLLPSAVTLSAGLQLWPTLLESLCAAPDAALEIPKSSY